MKTLINLVRIQCTAKECAAVLGMSDDTLTLRLKEEGYDSFPDFFKRHADEGRMSIRRAQYKLGVEDGNPTMLIWLGKQYLGQTDKQDLNHQGGITINLPADSRDL
jgi:hypothetical protein